MKIVVIGLDTFGLVLARELSASAHEVIVVDSDKKLIDMTCDEFDMSFVLDAMDMKSLHTIPFDKVDTTIVSIGYDFALSLKVTAQLKKMKVKNIQVRSIDQTHYDILQAFNIDRILTPLRNQAKELALSLNMGIFVDGFYVDNTHSVLAIEIPDILVGTTIKDLMLQKEFKLSLIAVTRPEKVKNYLGSDYLEYKTIETNLDEVVLEKGDKIVCYGSSKSFSLFGKTIK